MVRGCTGLSSCWLLVVFTPGIWLAGSLVGSCTSAGSVSVVSAMWVNWLVNWFTVINCRRGLPGVTVPLGLVPGRLVINHFSYSSPSLVPSMCVNPTEVSGQLADSSVCCLER